MVDGSKTKSDLLSEYKMLSERARVTREEADQVRSEMKVKQTALNTAEESFVSAQQQTQAIEAEIASLTKKLESSRALVNDRQSALQRVHQETAELAQRLGPLAQKQRRFQEALAMVEQNMGTVSNPPSPPIAALQAVPPAAPPPVPVAQSSNAPLSTTHNDSNRPPRIRMELDLSFEIDLGRGSEHNFYTGLTDNISEGGLFISTSQVLDLGTKIRFPLAMPGMKDPEVVEGVVRWVRSDGRSDTNVPPGIGVQFTNISERLKTHINKYVKQNESIFYDD